MTVRRKIHLRLCAGALLLALPVAATSTTVSGAPVAAASTSTTEALPPASLVFSGLVVTSVGQLAAADTAQVAQRVRATGDQRLEAASPTRPDSIGDVSFEELDIPRTAMIAYQVAASTMAQADADCAIEWSLLAAIGRVESDHGRHTDSRLGANGISRPLIRGVALDGKGPVAEIRDTDGGRLDGDKVWDRAVGPMQFLPSTWGYAGVDANGDGVRSPDNINDAALAAAVYLCAASGDLGDPRGVRTAVHRYNPSTAYVALVVRLAKAYSNGNLVHVPTGSTTLALGAVRTGSSSGLMTMPPTTPAQGTGQGTGPGTGQGTGPGTGNGDRGPGTKGKQEGDRPGKGNGNGNQDGKGGGNSGAHVEALPGIDSEEPLPGFKPGKDPKPGPKDPGPNPGPKDPGPKDPGPKDPGPKEPNPTDDPDPTPEPEPTFVELTGVLTYAEDVIGDEGTPTGQWSLQQLDADGELVYELLLDLGGESWMAEDALADWDGDLTLESNVDELTGLVGMEVDLLVKEGTEPAVVHMVSGETYRPAE